MVSGPKRKESANFRLATGMSELTIVRLTILPVLGEIMQKSTMSHNDDLRILLPSLLQLEDFISNVPPCFSCPLSQRVRGRCPFFVRLLNIPALFHQSQVNWNMLLLHLLAKFINITACITGKIGSFLYFGQSENIRLTVTVGQGGSKADEGGIYGASKGGRYHEADLVVVWESVAQSDALLLTKKRQQRIEHSVIVRGEVVVALCLNSRR